MSAYEVWLTDGPSSTEVTIIQVEASSERAAWRLARERYPEKLIRATVQIEEATCPT
jgi:hypothetical protein